MQRRKGKAWEQEVARQLRAALPGCNARRGWQARGGGKEAPDVVIDGLPVHLECKRGRKPNARAALAQAERDAADGTLPVAVVRDDRCEAFAVLRWDALLALLSLAWTAPEIPQADDGENGTHE